MRKFQKQDTIEEESASLLSNSYDPSYFLFSDWGVKDRYPDIDGQIRLRVPAGVYLNKYLHYQLKGTEKLKNTKYFCSREILDYLVETNIPTILFVVDTKTKTVYSYFLDKQKIAALELGKDQKGRTLDLTGSEFNKSNSAKANELWQKIAKKDNYNELNDSLSKIVADFHGNVRKCVGLLYLLQRVEKDKLPELFNKLLSISTKEVEVIIEKLDSQGILNKTSRLYLVENEQIGIECLFDLVESLDLNTLPKIFKDKDDLKLISKHLAIIKHPKVDKYFQHQFNSMLYLFGKPKSNDDLVDNLEILEGFDFRDSRTILKIAASVIDPEKIIPTKKYRTRYGNYYGKSYRDVLLKVVDILDDIRYLETKAVLKYLFILSKKSHLIPAKKIEELIKHLTEYDIYALKKIGYLQQVTILQELEKLSDKHLVNNSKVVLEIIKDLLDPSFHGSSMADYRTLTWSFGGLSATPALEDIRSRAIKLTINLISLLPEEKLKLEAIKTLAQAMYPPSQGNYSKELESLVLKNTEEILKYYIQAIGSNSDLLTQEIEEQVNRLIRRNGDNKSESLKELEQKIATDTEYNLFRVFVGYDYKLNKDGDWRAGQEERQKKVQAYVDQISLDNYQEWLDKIKNVVDYYEDVDPSKFQYFFEFLTKLGKEKPEIANKFVVENESLFERFLIHIVPGIYESSKSDLASTLITNWVDRNKHITACAVILAGLKTYDKTLFLKIARKAISEGNILAINNIIRGTAEHIKIDPALKPLFLECIKTLTKIKNTSWISTIWFRDKDLLNTLSKDEAILVLDNLVCAPDVDYQTEDILSVFADKYPEEIISYFYKRLQAKKLAKDIPRYEVLPFSLHELDQTLSKHSKVIVPMLLSWFDTEDEVEKLRTANFFEAIFPKFSDDLEETLLDIIKENNPKKASNILSILSAYKGQVFLYKTIQAFIEQFPLDKDTKNMLFIILSSTGVVSGEYGLSEGFKKKKEEIQSWKESNIHTIKQFALEYEKYLDEMIIHERTREEDTVTLMKAGH